MASSTIVCAMNIFLVQEVGSQISSIDSVVHAITYIVSHGIS